MSILQFLVVFAIGLAAGLVTWAILTMNRLTAYRAAIREAWLDCEITLKKRHELTGLIADAVEDEAPEEAPSTAAVLSARSQAMVDTKNFANLLSREKVLASTMNALMQRVDVHAGLKQNLTLVAKIQELLANESRMAADQRSYNARVHEYNRACSSFPTTLIAGLGGVKPIPHLDLPQIEGAASQRTNAYAPGDTAVFG